MHEQILMTFLREVGCSTVKSQLDFDGILVFYFILQQF